VLLEQHPGWIVEGESEDAQDLSKRIKATCPDLVLLDWGLPGMEDGLIAKLKGICPNLHIIVFSGRLEVHQQALDAGADAFIGKKAPPEQLLEAILGVNRAETS
jgi:DNA-binding NarL/FixJ family response regulator